MSAALGPFGPGFIGQSRTVGGTCDAPAPDETQIRRPLASTAQDESARELEIRDAHVCPHFRTIQARDFRRPCMSETERGAGVGDTNGASAVCARDLRVAMI